MTRTQYLTVKARIDNYSNRVKHYILLSVLSSLFGLYILTENEAEIEKYKNDDLSIFLLIGIIVTSFTIIFFFTAISISYRGKIMLQKLNQYRLDEKEVDLEKVLSEPEFAPLFPKPVTFFYEPTKEG